jgi:hypothetical protein
MPASTIVVHSGSTATVDVDFQALLHGILAFTNWQITIADKSVTFTDFSGAVLQMQGGAGPLLPTDFAVTGYSLTNPIGQVLFEIDWQGLQFVLRNQTETSFGALMRDQMGDILAGNDLNLVYLGGAGRDVVTGTDSRDTLAGDGGADVLAGDGAADLLLGGGGRDRLSGGDGDDRLLGQNGQDRLTGGLGADRFVFTGGDALRASGDTITDFSLAEGDRIDLTAIDARLGNNRFDAFTFVTTAFGGNKGELRLEVGPGGTQVQGDVNGDGVADFVLTLQGATGLDATAFVL